MSSLVSILALAGVLLVGWHAVVLGAALVTRPRALDPGPPTMELGSEPPAVVNLLVTRCELTAEAADATLLDLAAHRILEIYQPGDDVSGLLVRVRVAEPAGLRPYEQRVFDRVRDIAGDRLTPLREITERYADGGPSWLRQLRREVVTDARRRGLTRDRGLVGVVMVVSLPVAMALSGLASLSLLPESGAQPGQEFAWFAAWILGTVFVLVALFGIGHLYLRGERYTRAGRDVGARWLGVARWLSGFESLAELPPAAVAVWNRYLVYGVALGTNPVASRALDLRTGRRGRFTSRHLGRGRTVVVRYPLDPFAYTQAGARLSWSTLVLLAWGWFWLRYVDRLTGWPGGVRLAVYALGVLVPIRAVYRFVRAAIDELVPVTVTGLVLAVHPYRPATDRAPRWHQIVLDDGVHDRVRPWLMRTDLLAGVKAGDAVQVRGQRWTRYGLDLTVLAAQPPVTFQPRPPGGPAPDCSSPSKASRVSSIRERIPGLRKIVQRR